MSRYPPQRKEQTRRKILDEAGRRFRERGYEGIGLQNLMKGAGLTVGGFYAHFGSKEELQAEVLDELLTRSRAAWMDLLGGLKGEEWLAAIVRPYLSRTHRDQVGEGCPLAALSADVSRCSKRVRDVFVRQVERLALEMAAKLPPQGPLDPMDRSLAVISVLVGGLLLARAIPEPALSDRVLHACRRLLLGAAKKEKDP